MQNQENVIAHVQQEAIQVRHIASWEPSQKQQFSEAAQYMQVQMNHEHHAVQRLTHSLHEAESQLSTWRDEAQGAENQVIAWRNEAQSVTKLHSDLCSEMQGASRRYSDMERKSHVEEDSIRDFSRQLQSSLSMEEQFSIRSGGED